jgi:hypothetical protein
MGGADDMIKGIIKANMFKFFILDFVQEIGQPLNQKLEKLNNK